MHQSKQTNNLFNSTTQAANYCEVIIPLALPFTYTWFIPAHLSDAAKTGTRVEVQLRNKKYAGIIKSVHQNKPS